MIFVIFLFKNLVIKSFLLIFVGKFNKKMANKLQNRAYCLYLIIMLLFLCSCKDVREQSIRQVVAEWTGKEIQFPEGTPCQSLGQDTVCIDFSNQTYKILLYVDSVGCISCRLRLTEWKRIIAEADTLFAGEVDFLFFFQPKKRDERELQYMFRNNGFRHPVFIDTKNEINKLNKFPSQTEYQCFLLDIDNKVVLIGNPSLNTGIWQLFKRYISERDSKLTQGKKEESLSLSNSTTLPPDLPSKKKGGGKDNELIL